MSIPMFTSDNIPVASQNLFEPFDTKADATIKHFKAQLLMVLVTMFRDSKMKQVEFAAKAKITQPRLNKIMKGDFSEVSAESLIKAIINVGGTGTCGFNPETLDACFMITGQK